MIEFNMFSKTLLYSVVSVTYARLSMKTSDHCIRYFSYGRFQIVERSILKEKLGEVATSDYPGSGPLCVGSKKVINIFFLIHFWGALMLAVATGPFLRETKAVRDKLACVI